jgi:chromosome partitioning protein
VARIFAIANQKGGVGKTTSSINIAASLSELGKKVLLVDLDAQGNATMGSGINKQTLEKSVYEVLVNKCSIHEAIIKKEDSMYDVLPANRNVTAAEVELIEAKASKEYRLKYSLLKIKNQYDYILIDCPPSLNMLSVNAFVAAEGIIIPMQCEYYALEGLTDLMNTITRIREKINPELKIEGLIRTMYDPRSSLTRDVSNQLRKHFPNRLYRTTIPRNIRLAEAPSYGVPVIKYDRKSKGAIAYLILAKEIIKQHQAEK